MGETRIITIPDTISFKEPTNEKIDGVPVLVDRKFSFMNFLTWIVDSQPVFTRSVSGINMGVRILSTAEKAISESEKKSSEELPDSDKGSPVKFCLSLEDWQTLRDAVEKPHEGAWVLNPPRILLPYIKAITDV